MKTIFLFLVLNLVTFSANKLEDSKLFIADTHHSKLTTEQKEYFNKLTELDKYYSSKRVGSFVENGKSFFRLFTPSAENVHLVLFKNVEEKIESEHKMIRDNDGVWEASLEGELYGTYYGFRVINKDRNASDVICIDPYAKAVASYNTYYSPRKSIVVKEGDYNWEGDEWRSMGSRVTHRPYSRSSREPTRRRQSDPSAVLLASTLVVS